MYKLSEQKPLFSAHILKPLLSFFKQQQQQKKEYLQYFLWFQISFWSSLSLKKI